MAHRKMRSEGGRGQALTIYWQASLAPRCERPCKLRHEATDVPANYLLRDWL